MFKLFVFLALVAVAFATPGHLGARIVAPAVVATPAVVAAPAIAPVAYAGHAAIAAPLALGHGIHGIHG